MTPLVKLKTNPNHNATISQQTHHKIERKNVYRQTVVSELGAESSLRALLRLAERRRGRRRTAASSKLPYCCCWVWSVQISQGCKTVHGGGHESEGGGVACTHDSTGWVGRAAAAATITSYGHVRLARAGNGEFLVDTRVNTHEAENCSARVLASSVRHRWIIPVRISKGALPCGRRYWSDELPFTV